MEVSYENDPERVWLVRECAAGRAVSPPSIESLEDVLKFLEDLNAYEKNSVKEGA